MGSSRFDFRKILDYIPLAILIVLAIMLIIKLINEEAFLSWRHFSGALFLGITIFLFIKNHRLGVLALGATILAGAFSLISFSYPVSITTFSVGPTESAIPIFYGQPIFLLYLLIHFVCSIRHYIGIGTKEYWRDIKDKAVTN